MSDKRVDYWMECIAEAAQECDADLTESQLECIAESVAMGHECYGMAFYTPPPSDRIAEVEREWKKKYDKLKKRFDDFMERYDKGIRNLAGLRKGAHYDVHEDGEIEVKRS